ncbi:MAG: complex I subunit 1 family protein [Endomicrobiales bacterium]
MNLLLTVIHYLLFPGFLFLSIAGLFISWVDRKLAARLQWRVGPPLFQPWYDIRKLFSKELMIPEGGNETLFVLSPIVALLTLVYVGTELLLIWLVPGRSFPGDMFVFLYLLSVPSVCMMMGASASANPYASLGASREMKLILSYELPLLICVIVAALKSHSMSLGTIIEHQHGWSNIFSLSGFVALIVSVICIQAKMGMSPFDLSEAETELAGGLFVEYSGPLLAVWKLVKMILMVVVPLYVIFIFWGSGPQVLLIAKYAFVITVALLLRILSPRVRIDHALLFFWRLLTPLSIAALLLAFVGV